MQQPQGDQWQMQMFNTLNNVSAFFQRSYNQRKCVGKDAVHFVMTKRGLLLQYEDSRMASSKDLNYTSSSSSNPLAQDWANTMWIDRQNAKYEDEGLTIFHLQNGRPDKSNDKQTSFYIEQPRGENWARILMGHSKPSYWTNLYVSRRPKDGYNDPIRGLFKIVKF